MAPVLSSMFGVVASTVLFAGLYLEQASATPTIFDLAVNTPSLSTLESLVGNYATLVSALQAPEPLTVFAPQDPAFESLLTEYRKLNDTNFVTLNYGFPCCFFEDLKRTRLIENILQYHVLEGEKLAADLTEVDYATLLFNTRVTDVEIKAALSAGGTDIDASNGVVHLLDSVLIPPIFKETILEAIKPSEFYNQDLTTFNELLALRTEVADAIAAKEQITVYAPNDAAFNATGAVKDYLLYPHNYDILDMLLKSHVVDEWIDSEQIKAKVDPLPTLSGLSIPPSSIVIGTTFGSINIEPRGYIDQIAQHVKQLIIPENLLPVGDLVEVATAAGLTSLLAAATQAGLANDLSTVDETSVFTVFAPTNEALATFLGGTALGDVPLADLVTILSRHVIVGLVFSSQLETKMYETLAGEMVSVVVDSNGVSVNGVSVIAADNRAWNGVAHVVDAVILEFGATAPTQGSTTPSPAGTTETPVSGAVNGIKQASFMVGAAAIAMFVSLLL